MTPSKNYKDGVRDGKQEATLETLSNDIAEFRDEWQSQSQIVAAHSESITWLKRLVFSLYALFAGVGAVGTFIKFFILDK